MTKRRRPCPAARMIKADLEADICQARFDKTRSHRARVALENARTAALMANKAAAQGRSA